MVSVDTVGSCEIRTHLVTLKALCFVHLEWLVDGEEGYVVSMRLGKKMSRCRMKLQASATVPLLYGVIEIIDK